MYRESTTATVRSGEFTAALVLAPVAVFLALLALMSLFLGTELARLAPLGELLAFGCIVAVLWLGSVLIRPSLSVGHALRQLPAWCWVAGCALLTLAALAALSLMLAAHLIQTSVAEPVLATVTLALGVVVFWVGYGLASPGPGASRFSGPDTDR